MPLSKAVLFVVYQPSVESVLSLVELTPSSQNLPSKTKVERAILCIPYNNTLELNFPTTAWDPEVYHFCLVSYLNICLLSVTFSSTFMLYQPYLLNTGSVGDVCTYR